jgi:hypothetical protein
METGFVPASEVRGLPAYSPVQASPSVIRPVVALGCAVTAPDPGLTIAGADGSAPVAWNVPDGWLRDPDARPLGEVLTGSRYVIEKVLICASGEQYVMAWVKVKPRGPSAPRYETAYVLGSVDGYVSGLSSRVVP